MFFIAGISSKVKPVGETPSCQCPVCGQHAPLHLCVDYITPHLFFIPTVRMRTRYLATCHTCASVMQLDTLKGKQVERGESPLISSDNLEILQNNRGSRCPDCGEQLYAGQHYCGRCGRPI